MNSLIYLAKLSTVQEIYKVQSGRLLLYERFFMYQKFPAWRALKFDSLRPNVFLFRIRANFREMKILR